MTVHPAGFDPSVHLGVEDIVDNPASLDLMQVTIKCLKTDPKA